MEGNLWLMLLVQVVLIALNAVFACAKNALVGISEGKLEKLSEEGDKRAKKLLKLTNQPAKFLAAIQVAITLVGFFGVAFAAKYFSAPIVKWLADLGGGISESALDTIAVILVTVILSFFTLLFGVLIPKRVATRKTEKVALAMSGLVFFLGFVFRPLVWLLTVLSNGILRLFGIDPNENENDVSEEDIRDMVDSAAKSSQIDDEEREFIQNVFEFDDLSAGDIATHRTDVTMLWLDETDEEWDNTIHERCHMFYPVCNESVDDVVGVLYLKDYFRLDERTRENVMEKAVKKPYFVPETVKADVLFRKMRTSGKTFAVVLDEYGGMYGIVTMNDLISKLVGDFGQEDDEDTKDAPGFIEISENTWELRGNVSLDEIAETVGVDIPKDDFDTFSGMVFSEFGSIPADGETFELDAWGLHIAVTKVAEHQIEAATVTVTEVSDEETDDSKHADE